jgi:two-component system sensor histidine kinase/response regulator
MNGKEKILIIDDDESIQKSCRMVFSRDGYEVESALDGESGLKRYRQDRPDVVLVDLKMPGIDGMEVLRQLRSFEPDCVAIVITGYGTIQSAVEAMKRGAYDFLPKPFTPDELRIIVRRGLERRRFIRETARLRKEKQMMRDNFISMVSHELRSPLAAVQQNLMVITGGLAGEISHEARDMFLGMQTRIKGLITLIGDWLNLSRIESGEMISGMGPVDLKPLLAEVIETLSPLAEEKNVSLRIAATGPVPVTVGNRDTLRMLFTNLIHNGIKYSREGGKVEATLGEEDKRIRIEIKDTGIGIPADKTPLIFEQFYRVKGETEAEGSGLGLSIARKIAEMHSGSIMVESEPGKGSTFTVYLPTGGQKDKGQPKWKGMVK